MDLGHVCLALGWAVTAVLWYRRRPPVLSPLAVKKAMLLNREGTLDSVRTIVGVPPAQIACQAGTYHRDPLAASDHWIYRCR